MTPDAAAIMRELHNLGEAERRLFKKRFCVALHNLAQFEIYWSPSGRRILARSPAASRKFKLPPDAVLVGSYAHPFNLTEFLGDLNDVIVKLNIEKASAAARACA